MNDMQTDIFMIHKIEIFPHYTYPIIANSVNTDGKFVEQTFEKDTNGVFEREHKILAVEKSKLDFIITENFAPPYRTVSHYGFNYPSTYMPNITFHPACSITPVNLQRQKVIAFIKRLNAEVSDNHKIFSRRTETWKEDRISKTGKEDNIYENTINCLDDTDVVAIDTAESFISMAEIQLNTAKDKVSLKAKSPHSQQGSRNEDCKESEQNNNVDLQSNQFSSMLSISGSYPAATHSHLEDAENDLLTTTDSGDNFSNFELQSSRKSINDNLYRSYVQKNYIPRIIGQHHSIIDCRYKDEEPDPHKPESEQLSQTVTNIQSSKLTGPHDNKHITLTLNSLKRRASSMCDNKEKSKSDEKPLSSQTVHRTQFSDVNSSCDSSTASTAIEIHININVRNSDCAKNLRNHEQEFKSKLEKVIDDEITLITQELALASRCEREPKNTASFNLMPSHRCLSAPESIFLYGRDSSCTEADRQSLFNCNEPIIPASLDRSSGIPFKALRYRQTLALLEQELEILLNSIIRNMCDCKTKINQISEDIRTANLHVGPLKTTSLKKRRDKSLIQNKL